MPVDFFKFPCERKDGNCQVGARLCSEVVNSSEFGIYDDPENETEPPYILHKNNQHLWIAAVTNDPPQEIAFRAIDKCLILNKPDGTLDNRCDAMLTYSDNVIFVELKHRTFRGWLDDGELQLRSTIKHFKQNHNSAAYALRNAYVSNSAIRYPEFELERKEKFEDETGFMLKIDTNITIE